MHRDIIQLCKGWPLCTNFGKNCEANISFHLYQPLPQFSGPNEELQLDYAGPLPDPADSQISTLVAIDR